jgi:hypothetical protein
MMGFLFGYAVANSASNARTRRQNTPDGYEVWEFFVIMGTILIGIIWPIHLAVKLSHWGLNLGWAIFTGMVVGIIGLLTGPGYILIGIIYAGIWLGMFIENGKAAEEKAFRDRRRN